MTASPGRPAAPELDNPLWRYACALYACPGVAQACLALQDDAGCDVTLLLLAVWLGDRRRAAMTAEDLAHVPGHDWHRTVIEPLRSVRRRVGSGATEPTLARFYGSLKSAELAAEQIRIAGLFGWADGRFPERLDRPRRALDNMHLVAGSASEQAGEALSMIDRASAELAVGSV